jgi:hypothetical protein
MWALLHKLRPIAASLLFALFAAGTLPSDLAGQSRSSKKEILEPRPIAEAGIVSREVQPIGDPTMIPFVEAFPGKEWLYLETDHCRLASSLGPQTLTGKDRKRMAAELAELRLYFPSLPEAPKKLSAELYIFLLGMRVEKLYKQVQRILMVKDGDFPISRAAQKGEGEYMGDGPYLGEREKYEFVLHEERETHKEFTFSQRGLKAHDSVRWHNRRPSKMILSVPCTDSDLRKDQWLWPHVAHNASHMMLDGYKFFAYDAPLWLAEGLALVLEKQIEPDSWTREGGEGVFFERERSKDWSSEIRKLAKKGKAANLATLMRAKGPADLDRNDHLTAWSMTCFFLEKHPEKFAQFLGVLKGQLDERGYPTGRDMVALQRKQFKEIWNWTTKQTEEAWLAWVLGKDSKEDDQVKSKSAKK